MRRRAGAVIRRRIDRIDASVAGSLNESFSAVAEALRLSVLGKLLLATLLGGAIGLERELAGKPAGLRTNILICVGAALFTQLSVDIARIGFTPDGRPYGDTTRIAAQIVSGIGFLGAGAILHGQGAVVGLTTAATIWVVAAIGAAVGAGAYVDALGATAAHHARARRPAAGRGSGCWRNAAACAPRSASNPGVAFDAFETTILTSRACTSSPAAPSSTAPIARSSSS